MDKEIELLKRWLRRIKRKQLAHRLSAKRKGHYHLIMGIPVVIISAIVGLFAFSSIESDNKFFLIGTLSLLVSILSSLQTFLKFELKAKLHQDADIGYSEIRMDIEESLTFIHVSDKEEIKARCEKIRAKIENVNHHSPLISESIWKQVKLDPVLSPKMDEISTLTNTEA